MRFPGRPVAKIRRSAEIQILNLKVKATGERPSSFLNLLSREPFSSLGSTGSALLLPSLISFLDDSRATALRRQVADNTKNTGSCTVTATVAAYTDDDGWSIYRFGAIDIYLEVN